MSFLVPFYSALQPHQQILYRAIILTDEPGIPDDTYQLQEWYCPNPQCHCNDVHFYILAHKQNLEVLHVNLALDPLSPPAPIPEFTDRSPVYASKLFKVIAEELTSDPDFIQRLRQHYTIVKNVAADPTHPCHDAVVRWANTGQSPDKPSTQKSKRRKR